MSDDTEIPTADELWEAIEVVLAAKARGEEPTEDETGRAAEAAGLMAAVQLARAGVDTDTLERLFMEREWSAHISATLLPDGDVRYEVSIEWEDDNVESVKVEAPADA